jgi:hypothetical protein
MTTMACRAPAELSAARKEPAPQPAACDSEGHGAGTCTRDCSEPVDAGKNPPVSDFHDEQHDCPGGAPGSDDPIDSVLYWDALDSMCTIMDDWHDWLNLHDEKQHADVQRNYGEGGRLRKRTRFEINGLRFDVQLWARVDWHEMAERTVADELRGMAAFLSERADELERRADEDEPRRKARLSRLAIKYGRPVAAGGPAQDGKEVA